MLKSTPLPQTMFGVTLNGHGGFEQLQFRDDLPVPQLEDDEVLIKVGAAGINNTDINTRIGWYSKAVSGDTNAGASDGFARIDDNDASWSGIPLQFPRIQGADVCGSVVLVANKAQQQLLGQRVLVRTMQPLGEDAMGIKCMTFGSECDGGFAQYTKAKTSEVFSISSSWSDAQLASIPCAYSTAENMLHRCQLGAEKVFITGASGGVGSAAVQLAKRRGAQVYAMASASKFAELEKLGVDHLIPRDATLSDHVAAGTFDVVVDLVAGDVWPELLTLLKRGGRYVVAGAIAGPLVTLDVRTLYLQDLTFMGCTHQDEAVFGNLIGYIERNEIKPMVAKTYPLADIVQAQSDFLTKQYTGKLVLLP